MAQKYASKPKRPFENWVSFILKPGAIPAVVECKNDGGGFREGQRLAAWDFEGNYFAVRSNAGNDIWYHRENFNLLSVGTLEFKGKYTGVPCIEDYQNLIKQWRDVAILKFNGDADDTIIAIPAGDPQVDGKELQTQYRKGELIIINTVDDAKETLRVFADLFPDQLAEMNPHIILTQISMQRDFTESDIFDVDAATDTAKLMKAIEMTKNIQDVALRVPEIVDELDSLEASSVMMFRDGELVRRELKPLLSVKKLTDSFTRFLAKTSGAIFHINLTEGLTRGPTTLQKPTLPALPKHTLEVAPSTAPRRSI